MAIFVKQHLWWKMSKIIIMILTIHIPSPHIKMLFCIPRPSSSPPPEYQDWIIISKSNPWINPKTHWRTSMRKNRHSLAMLIHSANTTNKPTPTHSKTILNYQLVSNNNFDSLLSIKIAKQILYYSPELHIPESINAIFPLLISEAKF